jgi:hypothetical protein
MGLADNTLRAGLRPGHGKPVSAESRARSRRSPSLSPRRTAWRKRQRLPDPTPIIRTGAPHRDVRGFFLSRV